MAQALTVTQYANLVTNMVANTQSVHDIIIVGEITGLKPSSAGHYYFDLKDQFNKIQCTLFKGAARRLTFCPKDGMKVNVFGSASYYVQGGRLSFNVESMAESGKGDLKAALEALTAKLLKEGLFEPERKRKLPKYPRTIGVVTSASGSVIKDIIDTTARRYPVNILLASAQVQGDGAAESIIHGIELLNRCDVDLIIIGRGGGSMDDLSAFNDEGVVRAIANSKIPTISAVGHATDKSLTDRVADVYAETPTAAAMLATPNSIDEVRNVSNIMRRIGTSLVALNNRHWSDFNKLDGRLSPNIFGARSKMLHARLDGCSDKLANYAKQVRTKHEQDQMGFDFLCEAMDKGIVDIISDKGHRLEVQCRSLAGLDPKAVLGRGYSFVTGEGGKVLTSVSSISEGSDIRITMRDGNVDANVRKVSKR